MGWVLFVGFGGVGVCGGLWCSVVRWLDGLVVWWLKGGDKAFWLWWMLFFAGRIKV